MKIMILILMAFLSDLNTFPYESIAILVPGADNPYESITRAVTMIESANGKYIC